MTRKLIDYDEVRQELKKELDQCFSLFVKAIDEEIGDRVNKSVDEALMGIFNDYLDSLRLELWENHQGKKVICVFAEYSDGVVTDDFAVFDLKDLKLGKVAVPIKGNRETPL